MMGEMTLRPRHVTHVGLLCAVAVLAAAQAKPDMVLTREISEDENHSYREIPFEVPAGTTRITVDFSYTSRDQHTTIDLGLFDPERFRGWSGGKPGPITLSETDATASYLPGPIPAGRWKLLLGIPNIRPEVRSQFTARVYLSHSGETPAVSTFSDAPLRASPGWYRGDLHLHTAHSDGSCLSQSGGPVPCPVFKIVEAAAERHLDFIAITDHNTTSQYQSLRELQPYFDRVLLIPGREVTTFTGHANVFGTTEFIDFRVGSPTVPTLAALLDQVERLHALISINHPSDPSGETCMGCGWTAANTDFSRIQAMEAVNGGVSEGPTAGVPFWQAQLNRGFHLTGIGGSDTHRPEEKSAAHSGVGYPETVVYAQDLSERAILDGVRAGRVFIDVQGTHTALLEFTAVSGAQTEMMGGTLRVPAGSAIHFSVCATGVAGGRIETIEDGNPVKVGAEPEIPGEDFREAFDLTGDGNRHWIRINIRDRESHLVLIGNPIYVDVPAAAN